jgi:hypothetical protein
MSAQLESTAREVMGDDPFMKQLTDLLAGAALDPMLDLYLTPAALGTLIETGDFSLAALKGTTQPERAEDFAIELDDVHYAFFSDLATFRVELPSSVLTLRLQGLRWKLVEVQAMPEEKTGSRVPAPATPAK